LSASAVGFLLQRGQYREGLKVEAFNTSPAFNLLDTPWLPVRWADGRVGTVGLRDCLIQSTAIASLAETEPPSLMAQYRLLLALVHRALSADGGKWTRDDLARWSRDGLPQEVLERYFSNWRERFWLFHPEHPFMQVAALATADETRDKRKPWTQIALASANGNAPVVFDHAVDLWPQAVEPALALRSLLGFLQFTPGGLVKTFRDSDKAGPLANTAAVMPLGTTLAQTLCLALHAPASSRSNSDLPCWEQLPLEPAQLRGAPKLATGPNDRYTRLTRAVLLLPDDHGQVQWIRFGAGLALAEDEQAPDPMASYRAGSNGLVRVSFTEGRAFWRDLPALVPDPTGQKAHPAAVLNAAATLQAHLSDDPVFQPVIAAGLASDQAKLLRWRAERVDRPLPLLADASKAQYLRDLMVLAEDVHAQLRRLATSLVAATLPDPSSKDTRSRARSVVEAGPLTFSYFAHAERALAPALCLIGQDQPDQADTGWRAALRGAACKSWDTFVKGLGRSTAALRAEAKVGPRLGAMLNQYLPKDDPPEGRPPGNESEPLSQEETAT
jgi:CRISPR system Cascade subunit CasA